MRPCAREREASKKQRKHARRRACIGTRERQLQSSSLVLAPAGVRWPSRSRVSGAGQGDVRREGTERETKRETERVREKARERERERDRSTHGNGERDRARESESKRAGARDVKEREGERKGQRQNYR